MVDWSALYLLAEVCAQELRDLSAALVPVDFPRKRRSNLVLTKKKTETTGLKLRISQMVLGKRCFFERGHGHGSEKGNGFKKKEEEENCVGSSGAHEKQGVTATSTACGSFASSSCSTVVDDGHDYGGRVCGNGEKGKQIQRVGWDDSKWEKKQRVTFYVGCSSSSSTVTSVNGDDDHYLGSKEENHSPPLPNLERPSPPRAFTDRIQQIGGSEVKLVIEKTLFNSDLDRGQNRLTVPCKQIQNEFLKEDEKMSLCKKQEDGKHVQGMEVSVIEPCLDVSTLCLKKWDLSSSSSYALIKNWNNLAKKNHLMAGMKVQLWSFRVNKSLCFALVRTG